MKVNGKVRKLSDLCLQLGPGDFTDKELERVREHPAVYQDLMRAARFALTGAATELRRRGRRRELEALSREDLREIWDEIADRREAHAPIGQKDELDEQLIVEILSAKKPRRGTRR